MKQSNNGSVGRVGWETRVWANMSKEVIRFLKSMIICADWVMHEDDVDHEEEDDDDIGDDDDDLSKI